MKVCRPFTNKAEASKLPPKPAGSDDAGMRIVRFERRCAIRLVPISPALETRGNEVSASRLLSMVRKAREAYKSYCYISTNEVEVIGMVPKVIYMGYVGQFATNTPWMDINKVAIPYGEVHARTTATGHGA